MLKTVNLVRQGRLCKPRKRNISPMRIIETRTSSACAAGFIPAERSSDSIETKLRLGYVFEKVVDLGGG